MSFLQFLPFNILYVAVQLEFKCHVFSIPDRYNKLIQFNANAHPWWIKLELEPTTKIGLATTLFTSCCGAINSQSI